MAIIMDANRYNFSEKQYDIIEAGVALAKWNLYNEDPDAYKSYACFSNTGADLIETNKKFNESLMKEAYRKTGKATDIPIKEALTYQDFDRAVFSVIETIIDRVNSKNEIEEILTFAEVRNMAEGDSMLIDIKATNAYYFTKIGRGKNFNNIQRYFGQDVTLSPNPSNTTISFSRKDIEGGRMNWGREIARAIKGIRAGYLEEVANLLYSTTINPIGNKIIETANFSEDTFRLRAQDIQTLNNSANTVVYGTTISLGNILPQDTNLRLGLGMEYMNRGYIPTMFGTKAVTLPQAFKADNQTRIIPNNFAVISSTDVDRPIKIGISGETRIRLVNEQMSNTDARDYSISTDYDIKLAGQGRVCIIRTSS